MWLSRPSKPTRPDQQAAVDVRPAQPRETAHPPDPEATPVRPGQAQRANRPGLRNRTELKKPSRYYL